MSVAADTSSVARPLPLQATGVIYPSNGQAGTQSGDGIDGSGWPAAIGLLQAAHPLLRTLDHTPETTDRSAVAPAQQLRCAVVTFIKEHGLIAAVIMAAGSILGGVVGKTTGLITNTVTSRVTITQTVASTTPLGPKPTAVYLSKLQPQGGDTPMREDTQIGDQDFPHSIFYDNITSNQSNASACQNVADFTCQATDYSIAGARYHQFSAMLGVTDGCSGDKAHWSLSVDTVVIKSGPVAVNSSPQPIAVAIHAGNSLQLLASDSGVSGAACGGINITWGDAQLR